MQVWIGTSGYSYPTWVGRFYPEGTQPKRMLTYYCRNFPLVELNFTFYRSPSVGMLSRLADQAPPGFQFIVKLPRTLSHDQDHNDLPGFRLAVEELRQRGQLLGLLCQIPQAQHNQRSNRAWIDFLANELGQYRLAVEFRHRSWLDAEIDYWLRERHLDLVSVDVPDIPALYPRGLVQTSARVYVRWHSRYAENWYLSDKDRYDYDYDDKALSDWAQAIVGARGRTESAFLLFNNCQFAQASANARRMRELIARMGSDVDIVGPFGSSVPQPPRQRTLFDE